MDTHGKMYIVYTKKAKTQTFNLMAELVERGKKGERERERDGT